MSACGEGVVIWMVVLKRLDCLPLRYFDCNIVHDDLSSGSPCVPVSVRLMLRMNFPQSWTLRSEIAIRDSLRPTVQNRGEGRKFCQDFCEEVFFVVLKQPRA